MLQTKAEVMLLARVIPLNESAIKEDLLSTSYPIFVTKPAHLGHPGGSQSFYMKLIQDIQLLIEFILKNLANNCML